MGTKSKQRQKRKQARWDLGASQRQMVTQIVTRHNDELNMIRRHQGRELMDCVRTLREELNIPKDTKLGLDMQNPEKMFVREITAEELKQAAGQQAKQTNGAEPPSGD